LSRTPPDAGARARIERDLETNLFVEAGAGSGKTESLVRRVCELFAQGAAAPGEVAVITFTRRAAAELRERVQVRLEEAVRSEADPERRARLRDASVHLGEAFLGTIHAFCARLLREHPFEIGLDPEFAELDDLAAQLSYQRSWEAHLERLQREQPERTELLADLGLETKDLLRWYLDVAPFPDVELVRGNASRPKLVRRGGPSRPCSVNSRAACP